MGKLFLKHWPTKVSVNRKVQVQSCITVCHPMNEVIQGVHICVQWYVYFCGYNTDFYKHRCAQASR